MPRRSSNQLRPDLYFDELVAVGESSTGASERTHLARLSERLELAPAPQRRRVAPSLPPGHFAARSR